MSRPYRIRFQRCLWSPWAVIFAGRYVAAFSNIADAMDWIHDHASRLRAAI